MYDKKDINYEQMDKIKFALLPDRPGIQLFPYCTDAAENGCGAET